MLTNEADLAPLPTLLLISAVSFAQNGDGRTDVLNIYALPLEDGKISATPQAGYVMVCSTNLQGGGAQVT